MTTRRMLAAACGLASLLAAPGASGASGAPGAPAAEVKVGMITTLSGQGAALGVDIRDGFALAVKQLDGRLGGVPARIIEGDDQQKPDIAKQIADRMVSRDGIDIATGTVWSNLALALMPSFARAKVPYVSPNAGPSQLAGHQCSDWFFNTAFQNDGPHEAMGKYLADHGVKHAYLLAPNYPAGKDALEGFKRFYKGEVAGEVYTPLGQLDYAADIAQLQAAKPDAVYIFYPGGMGINFVKQYAQAGLGTKIPLYGSAFTLSEEIMPAMGDAALGLKSAAHWAVDLDTPANKAFVAAFQAAYGRVPSVYAAQAYDAAHLVDAAVRAVGGDVADKDGLRKALAAAKFDSVRPDFALNRNHFPIQTYYLREVVKDGQGHLISAVREPILKNQADAYVGACTK